MKSFKYKLIFHFVLLCLSKEGAISSFSFQSCSRKTIFLAKKGASVGRSFSARKISLSFHKDFHCNLG